MNMEKQRIKIAVATLTISLTAAFIICVGLCLSFPWLYRTQIPVLISVETHPDIVAARISGKDVPASDIRSFSLDSYVTPVQVELSLKDGETRKLEVLYSPDIDSSGGLYVDSQKVDPSYGVNVSVQPPLELSKQQSSH